MQLMPRSHMHAGRERTYRDQNAITTNRISETTTLRPMFMRMIPLRRTPIFSRGGLVYAKVIIEQRMPKPYMYCEWM